MARDDLGEYRRRRRGDRTPEPMPRPASSASGSARGPGTEDAAGLFVVQEHHARALHWDFRLERDGVLVSWAVPKGLPQDRRPNHLAVQTEDHPLEYADFGGDIPAGEYGGGSVTIWDRGTYTCEKWTDDEVKVVLAGHRVQGRYVLFRTSGKNWMVHRMDPPTDPDRVPMPDLVQPMLAVPGDLPDPADDEHWAYETKWDGVRVVAYAAGGRVRLMSRNDLDVTVSYPEVRGLGAALGSTTAVLDGEIVAMTGGRPDFGALQQRMHVKDAAQARRLAVSAPVVYLVFDVLHLDGRDTTALPWTERRALLDGLALAGSAWQTPGAFVGGGADVLQASRDNGLEGVVAKRLTAAYRPGRRSPDWRKVKNIRTQDVVVVGWKPGRGRRQDAVGSLVLAVHDGTGALVHAGGVGTGFSEAALDDLGARLRRLARTTSPLEQQPPRAQVRDVRWVTPRLVGEVAFTEWTADGRLRHPSWRGLRPDKTPDDVRREP